MLNTVIAIFLWLLGLCVGSFLNVVIYRLPLGGSLSHPRRSFCPACGTTIRAWDNIPVLSWVLLAGRCRACRAPISVQYPLIESATGLVFVLVFRLIEGGASAMLPEFSPVTDWPLLAAWLVLGAVLIACSGMDFVSYMIDTRVTNTAVLCGIALLAVWPRPEALLPTAQHPLSAAAVVAMIAGMAWLYRTNARELPKDDKEPIVPIAAGDDSAAGARESAVNPSQSSAAPESANQTVPIGLFGVAVLAGAAIWLLAAPAQSVEPPHPNPLRDWPTMFALLALFVAMVAAGSHPRAADHEISTAIESEGESARWTAVREFAWLLPAMLAGLTTALLLYRFPSAASFWSGLAAWSPDGGYVPIAGLSYSMFGVIVGVSAGWFLRIFFTLVIGREAFGVGDIYILAAAGAIGGWDIALLGLLISVGLATAGWLLSLLFKSTLIIPFGPWLALGFVSALWLQRPAEELAGVYRESIEIARQERPELLWLLGAILMAGTVVALAVARLARRMLESATEPAPFQTEVDVPQPSTDMAGNRPEHAGSETTAATGTTPNDTDAPTEIR